MEGASEGGAEGTHGRNGTPSVVPDVVIPLFPASPCPCVLASPCPCADGPTLPPVGNTVPGSGGRPDSITGVTPGIIGTPVTAGSPPLFFVILCACSSFCKNKASVSATLLDDSGIVVGSHVGCDCCNSHEIAVGREVLAREGRLVAPLRGWRVAVNGVTGLGLAICEAIIDGEKVRNNVIK